MITMHRAAQIQRALLRGRDTHDKLVSHSEKHVAWSDLNEARRMARRAGFLHEPTKPARPYNTCDVSNLYIRV